MTTTRSSFLASPAVAEFTGWLALRLPTWPVELRLPHSPFVTGGIQNTVPFGNLVPTYYRWRLNGMTLGDWWETAERLRTLAAPLRLAVLRDDPPATLAACEAVARWCADRNSRVGAIGFLAGLGEALPTYMQRVRQALWLDSPDPFADQVRVLRMNSTLSCAHALLAGDGLPLYESRIAVAMATLVELWRRDTGLDLTLLPEEVRFPALGSQSHRRLHRVFPQAEDPGVLIRAGLSESATAVRWADAAVRLGLIVQETLRLIRLDDVRAFVAWSGNADANMDTARSTAFIASLFMVGYDPRSLCAHQAIPMSQSVWPEARAYLPATTYKIE